MATSAHANPESQALIERGFSLAYNLDHDTAIAVLHEAVAADPEDPAAHRSVATVSWLHILFQRNHVLVDDYLGGITKRVKIEDPPADLVDAFHAAADRALELAEQRVDDRHTGGSPKLVVQGWSSGSSDGESTVGLVREVTHWLQYSPGVVVRAPRLELAGRGNHAASPAALLDVDYIVWIELRQDDDGFAVLWDLERATDRSAASGGRTPVSGGLPELPRRIAGIVLDELGVDTRAASSLESRVAAGDPSAYAEFLKLLAAPSEAGGGEAMLRRRVDTLEELRSQLGNYAPAATALGTAYLDLAGLVGGQGPYYEKATHALVHAFDLDPGYPPARAKLASLFAKLGRSEEAVELLSHGLATHPDYPAFHETLGYVLRYAGLMEESMASYRRGQELDSSLDNLVSTQDQITKSLIYLGDYDAALESHERMMSFLEESGRSPDEKQRFYEGVIHLYRADATSAVAAFRAGARLEPESVWTTFGRAYEAMALEDTARVEAVLEELERREVVDGERHYRLVHFATFAGHPDRALDHLQKATDGGFFNAPYLDRDPWLASLRPVPRFKDLLDAARARHDAVRSRLEAEVRR